MSGLIDTAKKLSICCVLALGLAGCAQSISKTVEFTAESKSAIVVWGLYGDEQQRAYYGLWGYWSRIGPKDAGDSSSKADSFFTARRMCVLGPDCPTTKEWFVHEVNPGKYAFVRTLLTNGYFKYPNLYGPIEWHNVFMQDMKKLDQNREWHNRFVHSFEVKAGEIVYIGDMIFNLAGFPNPQPVFFRNEEAAKKKLATFKNIRGNMVYREVKSEDP